LPKNSLRQSEKIQNIHNHPYQTALGSGQHSGLNKFSKLPNDHPQASEGPDKTSALISTDQPHNCNTDEAPQNSSSHNLTRKVEDWRDVIAQSLAATNRVTEQLNWLTVESLFMSCSISWMASLIDNLHLLNLIVLVIN
jgi:hypothetical protein